MTISKVVSGGQTGADRGGLDAAIELGVSHGGWCPKGRRAEDGQIAPTYQLIETASADYLVRTEQNVVDADATLVFTYGKPEGGSKRTVEFAKRHGRPCLCVDLAKIEDGAASVLISEWIGRGGTESASLFGVPARLSTLNVAGSRESKAPGIQHRVQLVMSLALRAISSNGGGP